LQTDQLLLLSTKEIDVSFWKKIYVVKYPPLQEFALNLLSTFGTTYICECTFPNMKPIKLKQGNCPTDESLSYLFRNTS